MHLFVVGSKQVSKALAERRERVEQAIKQKESIDAIADPKLRELGTECSSESDLSSMCSFFAILCI